MSTEVSLRARRTRAEPMPCRRASTRRSSKRPIGPISRPVTAAAAHTQVMSDRELRRDIVESRLDRTRALLALGGEVALQRLVPRRRIAAAAALACSRQLDAREPEHQAPCCVECRERVRRACVAAGSPCARMSAASLALRSL